MQKKIVIIGAGEQGRKVLDYIREINVIKAKYKVEGFLDDSKSNQKVEGYAVLGGVKDIKNKKGIWYVVAIGNNYIRAKLLKKIEQHNGNLETIIHPKAEISKSVEIGKGSIIGAGAIIVNNARVGKGVILDSGVIVEHDNIIENYVNISPRSALMGAVKIQEYTWVGGGTIVKDHIKIGKNCIIGLGSVVLQDIPDNSLAYGSPAKIKGYVDGNGKYHYKQV